MKAENIKKALKGATKRYTAMRKKEERGHRVVRNSYMYIPSDRVTVREVAFEVMEDAYMKASGNGKYPANVRQVMYAARPAILAQGTKDEFTTAYFTQTLWPAYIEEHDPDWAENVAYDARGHFAEPHLPDFHRERHELGLGTLEVREYLHGIGDNAPEWVTTSHLRMRFPTHGPCNRFGAMLFIEKEGFMPLFDSIDLANRFDIAIMSTKGQSVTACRHLVDQICSEYDIPLVVLHDFDKAGFSILGGFQRNTKRYTWVNEITVHDIAVRLNDVQEYSIDPEPCRYKGNSTKVKKNLRLNGATEEEIKFLITEDGWGWTPGQRVELNAFTSEQLVEIIETGLDEAGITKVIPDLDTLKMSFRRAAQIKYINAKSDEIAKDGEEYAKKLKIPSGLLKRIRKRLDDDPEMPWDDAIAAELPEIAEVEDRATNGHARKKRRRRS